ncbi:MAG TPA: hypothetical protein VFC50_00770 [Candidatus Dormibacteraeota bacterium]|nr:hypothetical protein [Candidatus Dormibacteraeota bacterium]
MTGERTIGVNDQAAAAEIMAKTYELLETMALVGLETPDVKTPEAIYRSRACQETSDAVTRIAHEMGIAASRESHHHQQHHITSFGPLDRFPNDNDPVICLTLGQFEPSDRSGTSFFGARGDLARYFPFSPVYADAFGVGSIVFRHVTHVPYVPEQDSDPEARLAHRWLATTTRDVATGAYPMGEVSMASFAELQASLPPRNY